MDRKSKMNIPRINFKNPYVWLATWFGIGLMRPSPGTWGSLAAIPFGVVLFLLGGPALLVAAIATMTLIGIRAASIFERESSTQDNSLIVIDEVVGQWIALLPVLIVSGASFFPIALSFILFRTLDILKPWPISWLDKNISGGLGVMLDDIVAGIFAAIILTGILYAGLG
jgi:phosphatidylglycerophosphatase A